MTAIRYDALNGVYVAWVQELAEQRRAFLEGCPGPAARSFVAERSFAVA